MNKLFLSIIITVATLVSGCTAYMENGVAWNERPNLIGWFDYTFLQERWPSDAPQAEQCAYASEQIKRDDMSRLLTEAIVDGRVPTAPEGVGEPWLANTLMYRMRYCDPDGSWFAQLSEDVVALSSGSVHIENGGSVDKCGGGCSASIRIFKDGEKMGSLVLLDGFYLDTPPQPKS